MNKNIVDPKCHGKKVGDSDCFGKNIVDRMSGKTPRDEVDPIFPPKSVKINKRKNNTLNLNIETWADIDNRTYACWGDYWVKQELIKEFTDLGVNVGVLPSHADATLYLWGAPFPIRKIYPFFYNPSSFNMAWFYSHPKRMIGEEAMKYDLIFCLSKPYTEIISQWWDNVYPESLIGCSNFSVPEDVWEKDIDILFIGNARGGNEYGRKAIEWLDVPDELKVSVYGHKWYNHEYMEKWFSGKYWPYEELNNIYHRSKITLVDGHEDMNELGFVQVKIFDVLSSGGFVISSYNSGIKEIFGDSVPMFKTKNEMNKLIRYFLKNDDDRESKILSGYGISSEHNFRKRAKKILSILEKKLVMKK